MDMPRAAIAIVSVLALSTQPAKVPALADDRAWLIAVDDLHVQFIQTGRLRTLLRTVTNELVHDGDTYQFHVSGPSAVQLGPPVGFSADRDRLANGIKAMTGNALKDADALGIVSTGTTPNEVLTRAIRALDAVEAALSTLTSDVVARRKAIIYVSEGWDVDGFPALADRIGTLTRRASEEGITLFAIDARTLAPATPLDPRIDAAAWSRYARATRRSLTMLAEPTGGFVIESSDALIEDLKRIGAGMP